MALDGCHVHQNLPQNIADTYLILFGEGSNSGVISTPFSTAFEMSKTVNDAAEVSQRDSSEKSIPETMVKEHSRSKRDGHTRAKTIACIT